MKSTMPVFMMLIGLSGCASTPLGNIEAFGVAAENVSDKIDSVIDEYNKANVSDRLVMMAQSNRKYVKSDLDPIRKIVIRDSDKKSFALYKANKALGDYSKSLTDLASAGSQKELSLAGVKLSRSLSEMNDQYKVLTESEVDIVSSENSNKLGRIVAEVSSFYAGYKRSRALKEVIIAADPSIQIIGDVLSNQLLKGVIEGRLYTMKGNELAGYISDYNAKVQTMSFSQRKKALDDIYAMYMAMESVSATIVQAQKAVLSVTKAHGELAAELRSNRFSGKKIAAALKDIKTVHKGFNDLEELMRNCETEIVADDEKGIICKASGSDN